MTQYLLTEILKEAELIFAGARRQGQTQECSDRAGSSKTFGWQIMFGTS
jgi:hypothetical protein